MEKPSQQGRMLPAVTRDNGRRFRVQPLRRVPDYAVRGGFDRDTVGPSFADTGTRSSGRLGHRARKRAKNRADRNQAQTHAGDRQAVEDGSACVRALRKRDPIIVEDVLLDEQFVPCRAIVARAGIRAVQSTPLISTSGALVGVVSTHFPASHRPTELQMLAIAEAARGAANAIIHVRANDCADLSARRHNSLELLVQSRAAIARADELLSRRTRIGASHSG